MYGSGKADDTAGGAPDAGGPQHADGAPAPGPEILALERELTVFIRRARASSGELARAVHPELEPAAYGLLARLAETGAQRAASLAGYFGVGRGTMSRQLAALERLGLVCRAPDPADGRAQLIRLTAEGRARFACVRRARRAQYRRRLAEWDPAEIVELARLLHRLNEAEAAEARGADSRGPLAE